MAHYPGSLRAFPRKISVEDAAEMLVRVSESRRKGAAETLKRCLLAAVEGQQE
jgi:hypothetical protein